MTAVRWTCTSCPAQGVGQGQTHVDQTRHAVIASSGEPFNWPLCRCGHKQGAHAYGFKAGHVGRCLTFEGCQCESYEGA